MINDFKNMLLHKNSPLYKNTEQNLTESEKMIKEKIKELNQEIHEIKLAKKSINDNFNLINTNSEKSEQQIYFINQKIDLLKSEHKMIVNQFASVNSDIRKAIYELSHCPLFSQNSHQISKNEDPLIMNNYNSSKMATKYGSFSFFNAKLNNYKTFTFSKHSSNFPSHMNISDDSNFSNNYDSFPQSNSTIKMGSLYNYKIQDMKDSDDRMKNNIIRLNRTKLFIKKPYKARKNRSQIHLTKSSARTTQEAFFEIKNTQMKNQISS